MKEAERDGVQVILTLYLLSAVGRAASGASLVYVGMCLAPNFVFIPIQDTVAF